MVIQEEVGKGRKSTAEKKWQRALGNELMLCSQDFVWNKAQGLLSWTVTLSCTHCPVIIYQNARSFFTVLLNITSGLWWKPPARWPVYFTAYTKPQSPSGFWSWSLKSSFLIQRFAQWPLPQHGRIGGRIPNITASMLRHMDGDTNSCALGRMWSILKTWGMWPYFQKKRGLKL